MPYTSSQNKDNSETENQDNFFVETVEKVDNLKLSSKENQLSVIALTGVRHWHIVKFNLDTVAQINILPNKVYAKITSKPLNC